MSEHFEDPFWVVWGEDQGPPTVRYSNKREAGREAGRLARTNPGIRFIVLKAEFGYRKPSPEVEVTEFSEMPF